MSRWLLFPLVALLLLAATAAATVYTVNALDPDALKTLLQKDDAARKQTAGHGQSAAPIFLELEPFTVTLRGRLQTRILYTGITLRLEDQRSRDTLDHHMPEVRDRVLRLLYAQDIEQIQTPDGQQALSERLRDTLGKPYSGASTDVPLMKVLFTALVVQ